MKLLPRLPVLSRYLALSYLVLLANTAGYLAHVRYVGWLTPLYAGAVYLTWCWLFVLPVFIAAAVLDLLLTLAVRDRLFRLAGSVKSALVYGFACLGFTAVQLLLYTDRFVYRLYGFHLNGFVWNLVTTRGGLESMGSTSATQLTVALTVLAFLGLEALLLVALLRWAWLRSACERWLTRRVAVAVTVSMVALAMLQQFVYGYSDLVAYRPVVLAADAMPFYDGLTFQRLAKRLGVAPTRTPTMKMAADEVTALHYPLKPIVRTPDHKPWNLVWLVAESWRWDMLAPDIMPATWSFAQRSARFEHHYSTGHGTRMAMFGMFYGLYSNYWWAFLNERRGPILMDILLDDNYQFGLYTSAKFTYPEFDATLFARFPTEQLHEDFRGLGWERDRRNVAALLDFIRRRDRSRPFMAFLFLESPHAPYHFPPENAIRKPYLEVVNYATMDVARDAPLLKARYINSCNHLDGQFDRILKLLAEGGLLDSTIVLLTGDHGEEFMEKGRWGHNSDFSEEQTRSPLVVYVPGRPPAVVSRMTSHLDIPATLLPLLGVTNPPEDYSLGLDLFGDKAREFTIVNGWDETAYVDLRQKAIFPTSLSALRHGDRVTTKDDVELTDEAAFLERHKGVLAQILRDMKKFAR